MRSIVGEYTAKYNHHVSTTSLKAQYSWSLRGLQQHPILAEIQSAHLDNSAA
jgi:hypothetical protein